MGVNPALLVATGLRRYRVSSGAAGRVACPGPHGWSRYCPGPVAVRSTPPGGPLADGYDYLWIEPHREAVRRQALDATTALADALTGHPDQQLAVLEPAIALHPWAEDLYRAAMRAHHRLGQLEPIRELHRAVTTAEDDLDAEPGDDTLDPAATSSPTCTAANAARRYDRTPEPPHDHRRVPHPISTTQRRPYAVGGGHGTGPCCGGPSAPPCFLASPRTSCTSSPTRSARPSRRGRPWRCIFLSSWSPES